MKRLLLVMGMVGCGRTVDKSKLVERDGLAYEGDSETPFTGVLVEKDEKESKGTGLCSLSKHFINIKKCLSPSLPPSLPCRALGQPRNTQRYQSCRADDDRGLLREMRSLARHRFGSGRIYR